MDPVPVATWKFARIEVGMHIRVTKPFSSSVFQYSRIRSYPIPLDYLLYLITVAITRLQIPKNTEDQKNSTIIQCEYSVNSLRFLHVIHTHCQSRPRFPKYSSSTENNDITSMPSRYFFEQAFILFLPVRAELFV